MTATPTAGWRRLHPLTVFKELGGLAWAIVAALVLDFEQIPFPVDFVDADVIVAIAVFGYAVTRYFFTAYRITDRTLELRRGVFVKSLQVMPRERVQAVNAITGFVGRILGVTTVEVSAADAEDIKLGFVSEEEGERLRLVLEVDAGLADEDEEKLPEPLASIDPGKLVLYGLTQTSLAIFILVVVGAIVVAIVIGNAFLPLPTLFVAFWPVFQTVNLVGFRSWLEHDRIRAEAGVIGKRRAESPLDRIQVVEVLRPPLRRLLGYETVRIVTGDAGVSPESLRIAGMVAPLRPLGQWREVADPLVGTVLLDEGDLEESSRLTIRRAAVRGGLLVAALVAGAWVAGRLVDWGWWPALVVALAGAVVVGLYAVARWKVLGWAVSDRYLVVRRGVVDQRLTVTPIHKVQDVTVRQTFFQHRLGIANVEVDTAGVMGTGRILAVDLPVHRARELADHLAEAAARVALPDGV